jgi:hypothetical protein
VAGGQQAVPGPAGAGCQQKEVPVSRFSQRLKFIEDLMYLYLNL